MKISELFEDNELDLFLSNIAKISISESEKELLLETKIDNIDFVLISIKYVYNSTYGNSYTPVSENNGFVNIYNILKCIKRNINILMNIKTLKSI